jgi:penicillin-binding protein 1C
MSSVRLKRFPGRVARSAERVWRTCVRGLLARRWQRRMLGGYVWLMLLFIGWDAAFPLDTHLQYARTLVARDGTLLAAFLSPDDKWRMHTPQAAVSPLLVEVILDKEDRAFYWHPGINPLAVGRALWQNLTTGRRVSGASTLSMQCVRMLHPKPRTWRSKLLEALHALQLEWHHSKADILMLYLNHVPYGGNVEGVQAASLRFFGKAPTALSLAECVTLAMVPNSPRKLALRPGNRQLLAARNDWLQRLTARARFPQQWLAAAQDEPLGVQLHPMPRLAPHLARRLHATGGTTDWNIATTVDAGVQRQVQQLVAHYAGRIRLQGITQVAALVVDNRDRSVLAYVGSADFDERTFSGQVDGVAAVRSPGSTLKPLAYAMAIDAGHLTPKTIVADVETYMGAYRPENYDRRFHGPVSVEYALAQSLNIPAVKVLQQLGPDVFVQALAGAGFRQVEQDAHKLGISVILGGCGATLEELVGLYVAFANGGWWVPLRYTATERPAEPKRILSREASYLTLRMLTQLVRPDLPASWQNTSRLPRIAWKTGTSYGRRDAWAVGVSGRFTIGVWVGNFDGTGNPALNGADMATPLLFELFSSLSPGEQLDWLRRPLSLATRKVCTRTGLPPGPQCPSTLTDDYLPGVSLSATCTCRKACWVDADGRWQYLPNCLPPQGARQQVYDHFAPEVLAWYRAQAVPVQAPPPLHASCTRAPAQDGLTITSPAEGASYLIDRKRPRKLSLEAHVPADAQKLYWFANGQFLGSVPPGQPLFWQPQAGPLLLEAQDDRGRRAQVRCTVEWF